MESRVGVESGEPERENEDDGNSESSEEENLVTQVADGGRAEREDRRESEQETTYSALQQLVTTVSSASPSLAAWLSGFQSTMGNSGRSGSPLPPRVAAATAVGASSSDASAVTVATAPEDSDAAATVAVSSDSVSSEADASAALPPSTAAEGLFHTISAPCFSMELHDWLESSGLGSTDLLGSLTRAMDSEPAGEARSSLALLASNLVHSLQLRRIQDVFTRSVKKEGEGGRGRREGMGVGEQNESGDFVCEYHGMRDCVC
ncbi:unnamed protein product [Closterium sp. NIES-53]